MRYDILRHHHIRSTARLAAALALVAIAGCLTPGSNNWFQGSQPGTRDYTTRRFPVPREPAPPVVVEKQPERKQPDKKTGPSVGNPNSNDGVTLTVAGPGDVQRGSLATFDVNIKNDTTEAVENLSLVTQFDAGLEFPGADTRKFTRKIDRLQPGASKLFSLTLRCKTDGRQCSRFSLNAGDSEVVWKSVCLMVDEPLYGVDVILPKKRTAGSRVEPTVVLSNHSKRTLQNVRLEVGFDPTRLRPHKAGRRVQVKNDTLRWTVGNLKPGEGVPLQVEFDCLGQPGRCCLSTRVTVDDGPGDARYVCFETIAPPKTFDLQISETRDLLQIGDETEFIAVVRNRTDAKAAGPSLTVDVPANFRIVSAEAWSGAFKLPVKPTVKEGRVTFPSPGVIAAKSEVSFRIRAKAMRSAQAAFRAEMLDGTTSLLELDESVIVLPK